MKGFSDVKQLGVSLIEGMVAMGLLTGVGLGAMKLGDLQKDSVKVSRNKSGLARTMNLIKETVSDPQACELNFKGKAVDGTQLDKLVNSQGAVIIERGQVSSSLDFTLVDIKLGEHRADVKRTSLMLTFEKNDQNKSNGGVVRQVKFINLFTEVSSNAISSCLDPAKLSADILIKNLCFDADPAGLGVCNDNYPNLLSEVKRLYCNQYHQFLNYNAATGKCMPIDANQSCGSGLVQGYDAVGKVICYTGGTSTTGGASGGTTTGGTTTGGTTTGGTTTGGTTTGGTTTGGTTTGGTTTGGTTTGGSTTGGSTTGGSTTGGTTTGGTTTGGTTTGGTTGGEEECEFNTGKYGRKSGGAKCMKPCSTWSGWYPEPSEVCKDLDFEQTKTCLDSGSSETQKRSATGSKNCAAKVCVYHHKLYNGVGCSGLMANQENVTRSDITDEAQCMAICKIPPMCKGAYKGYYEEVSTGSCRMEKP